MPNATPRAFRRDLFIVLALVLGLPLFLAACEILEVLQPSTAETGEVIEVTVTIEQPYTDVNPARGVVSVLVPTDWSFVSGTYSGDVGSGDMIEDAGWSDSTEIVLPAPAGMKWIATISEDAHDVPSAPAIMDAVLEFEVGTQVGTFQLGYFTTTDAFATPDIVFGDNLDNTADSLMDQPITVTTTSANEDGAAPGLFALEQNAPNPFSAATAVRYSLGRAAAVDLAVYDAVGRRVAVLAQGPQAAGAHAADLDARGLPSGTYLYRLAVDGKVVDVRRMTLAR